MRFTPDSRRLVTAGRDGHLSVWNVRDATRIGSFAGHAGGVRPRDLAGRATVYSADQDGNVMEWDLSGARRLGQSFVTPRSADRAALRQVRRGGDARPAHFAVPARRVASTWSTVGSLTADMRIAGPPRRGCDPASR